MSALAEVWHIVRKDAQHLKWLLIAYATFVVAATVNAMAGGEIAGGYLQLAAVLLIILGPITAAILVQSDSPTQADAFWASQPFRRSSMLIAKVAMTAGFLLALPLVGQLLGLIAFDVPASDVRAIMLVSALYFGFVLLIAMFLAALTRDVRSWVLAVLALFAASTAVGIAISESNASLNGGTVRLVVTTLGIIGVVVLLILLYLRRHLPAVRVLSVAALAMILVGSIRSNDPRPSGGIKYRHATGRDSGVGIAIELRDTARISEASRVNLRVILVGANGPQRYRLDGAEARFFLHDGWTLDMPLSDFQTALLSARPMVLPGITSLQIGANYVLRPFDDVHRDLTSDQRRALMRGIDSVRVTGVLTVLEPNVFATLPLRIGAEALRDGRSVRVDGIDPGEAHAIVNLHIRTVGEATRDWMGIGSELDAFLVNEQRREGLTLSSNRSSSNPGLLVLPGAGVHHGNVQYGMPLSPTADLHAPGAEWMNDAKLMLVTWVPSTSYNVSAWSVPLPPLKTLPRRRASPPVVLWGPSGPIRTHR